MPYFALFALLVYFVS